VHRLLFEKAEDRQLEHDGLSSNRFGSGPGGGILSYA
jgi:hypothetical protein